MPEDSEDILPYIIKASFMSVANTVIVPMQDWLGLGAAARINTPSTLGGNWVWRMKEGAFSASLAKKMHDITKLYGRL